MTVSRQELRKQFDNESPPPATAHPSRSDLETVAQALRNGWPITEQKWQDSATAALRIILDADTLASLKLSAVMMLVEAGRAETVGVAALRRTLKKVLSDGSRRQADEGGPDPPEATQAASTAPENAPP